MEVDKTTPRSGRTTVSRAEQEVQAITLLLRKANHVERTPRARKRVRRRIRILHQIWIHRGLQKTMHLYQHYQISPRPRRLHQKRMCRNWLQLFKTTNCVLFSKEHRSWCPKDQNLQPPARTCMLRWKSWTKLAIAFRRHRKPGRISRQFLVDIH